MPQTPFQEDSTTAASSSLALDYASSAKIEFQFNFTLSLEFRFNRVRKSRGLNVQSSNQHLMRLVDFILSREKILKCSMGSGGSGVCICIIYFVLFGAQAGYSRGNRIDAFFL